MAKLYFRYGAMNSGKSTALLQAAYNYEEREQHVLLAKPRVDSKGGDTIVSRLGVVRPVDFLIAPSDSLSALYGTASASLEERTGKPVSCLLIDEAQFLTGPQVVQAFDIAVTRNVPVLCYGIRTDFRTHAFPGSARLLELAHSLEELKTICRCGRKAIFNGRKVNGRFIAQGEQVAIDSGDITYESLCGQCYLREVGPIPS